MRRLCITIMAMAAGLAACGDPAATPGAGGDNAAPPIAEDAEGNELLFLGMGQGVKVFDTKTEAVMLEAAPAVPSQQGNIVYQAIPRAGGTEVAAFDPANGHAHWSTLLPEPSELRVASQDGTAAVLGAVRPTDGTIPGRTTTHLTVVRGPDDVRGYDVPGNVEPETFSSDAGKLFLVDYLPPEAPVSYSLKLLDLDTGEVGEVFDAHGGHREPMEGTARRHVYSPDGTRLYTYYEILGDPYYEHMKGPYRAFVHVLDLEEEWAHCVVLDEPFGTIPGGAGATLTVAPEGDAVYVTDPTLGLLAEIDTELLRVVNTSEVVPPQAVHGSAAVTTDDTVFVSYDNQLHAVDRETRTAAPLFAAASPVGALYVSRSGDKLYAALPDRVVVYDTATNQRLGELLVGKEPVEYFDPSGVPLDATSDVFKCAC